MAKRKRKLRSAAKWSCLSLTIALAIMWIGSLWFMYDYRAERWHTAIAAGRIQFGWDEPFMGGPGKWIRWHFVYRKMNGLPRDMYWKFNYQPDAFGSTPLLFIPLWCPTLLAAIPTAIFFAKSRRRLPGLCRRCGFDLAGLPSASKCPECGILTSSQPPPSTGTHT